jgi:hypothetical protein
METTVLTKTSADGRSIEIRIHVERGLAIVVGYLAGQQHAAGLTTLGRPVAIKGQSYVASVGKLALTQAEADTVRAACRAAELATPEGQAAALRAEATALRAERRMLVVEVNGALDDTRQARERGSDEDLGNIPDYDSREYREALARLAAFDAAHPEVKAAIKAEREADRIRHQWD